LIDSVNQSSVTGFFFCCAGFQIKKEKKKKRERKRETNDAETVPLYALIFLIRKWSFPLLLCLEITRSPADLVGSVSESPTNFSL
jgi:hypothetical protein